MPVRKFRTIEEATVPIAPRPDGRNIRSAIELSELCLRLRPIAVPRGVRRFESAEQAHQHRLAWEREALEG